MDRRPTTNRLTLTCATSHYSSLITADFDEMNSLELAEEERRCSMTEEVCYGYTSVVELSYQDRKVYRVSMNSVVNG